MAPKKKAPGASLAVITPERKSTFEKWAVITPEEEATFARWAAMTPEQKAGFDDWAVMMPTYRFFIDQYSKLLIHLGESTRDFNAADAKDYKSQLKSCIRALRAVIRFLRADDMISEKGLSLPLSVLEVAAYDAGRGARPPLLYHPLKRNEKTSHTTREYVQGEMAYFYELRILTKPAASRRRADITKRDADFAHWLADAAYERNLRCEDGSRISENQITNWNREVNRPKTERQGGPLGARRVFSDRKIAHDPGFKKLPPAARAAAAEEFILDSIKKIAAVNPRSAPKAKSFDHDPAKPRKNSKSKSKQ